jgi:hypothetical protein
MSNQRTANAAPVQSEASQPYRLVWEQLPPRCRQQLSAQLAQLLQRRLGQLRTSAVSTRRPDPAPAPPPLREVCDE